MRPNIKQAEALRVFKPREWLSADTVADRTGSGPDGYELVRDRLRRLRESGQLRRRAAAKNGIRYNEYQLVEHE